MEQLLNIIAIVVVGLVAYGTLYLIDKISKDG